MVGGGQHNDQLGRVLTAEGTTNTYRQSDSQTVRYQTFLKQTDMERKCQVFLRGAYACGELTVHLYQEFRLHSPASLMLTV